MPNQPTIDSAPLPAAEPRSIDALRSSNQPSVGAAPPSAASIRRTDGAASPLAAAFALRVSNALAENPHLANRRLRIEAQAGRVTLRGVVNSYYQKQMAQETVRRLEGVSEIENRLEVAWS